MKTLTTIIAMVLATLSAVAAPTASIGLTWRPNTETDIKGYFVHQGTSSRTYTSRRDVGLNTIVEVPLLEVGITYFFAVTAVNIGDLESLPSNEVSYRVPSAPTVPSALTGVSYARSATNILIRWTASPTNETVTRYRIQYRPANAVALQTAFSTSPQFLIAPVDRAMPWVVQVSAENVAGIGTFSEVIVHSLIGAPILLQVTPGSVVWTFSRNGPVGQSRGVFIPEQGPEFVASNDPEP